MTNRPRRCLLPAVLPGLGLLATGCAAIERPEVLVTDMLPVAGGTLEQRFRVDLRVLNPNDFELPVKAMEFRLSLNDAPLARGLSNERFTVPAFGETETSVTLSTTLLDLVRQVLVFPETPDLTYALTGRVHLDRPFTPAVRFSSEGQLDLDRWAGSGGLFGSPAPIEPMR